MALAVAHYWRVMPHTLWRYPFRYYKELRDAYVASFRSAPEPDDDDGSTTFDVNAEQFAADSL